MSSPLIGSIIERKPSSSSPASVPTSNESRITGFPPVQHRSKSAFAQAREDRRKPSGSERPQHAPVVVGSTTPRQDGKPLSSEELHAEESSDNWRSQIEEENRRKVESMSTEEIEQERREILEKFGPSIQDVLRKARAAREAIRSPKDATRSDPERKPLRSAMASRPSSPDPLSSSSTRPSSRSDKHLRFADVTPQDVYVYESAPPSPRKKPLALMSPTLEDGPTISLGEWKGKNKDLLQASSSAFETIEKLSEQAPTVDDKTEMRETQTALEGTPEDIRRRFFPSVAPHEPSLAWIEAPDPPAEDTSTLRFDLSGAPISSSLSATLPTHLGLHHHAEGTHAGYTLDDIFLLSRSTVSAQRASMLDILGRIVRRLSSNVKSRSGGILELRGQETQLRKRVLAAAVEALGERATVGVRAVEVAYICLVVWDEDILEVNSMELKGSSAELIASLPIEYLLQRAVDLFGTADLPHESLVQMLGIIRRLAQESNQLAGTITSTQNLAANLVSRFILTAIPPEDGIHPEPLAIETLNTLSLASRANAVTVAREAETLLRFVVTLPHSSPYPEPLAIALLISTLELYRTLAGYGLRAHLSSVASEPFGRLMRYTISEDCTSVALRRAWLRLIEAWIVCAQDPHRTSPTHDILWSQVIGWDWGRDMLDLRARLSTDDLEAWSALWSAQAAWLEGSCVNGIRVGQEEKALALSILCSGFESGPEKAVVNTVIHHLDELLGNISLETFLIQQWREFSYFTSALASVIRLWISCLPAPSSAPLDAPPFPLPFPSISAICAKLTTHPLWAAVRKGSISNHAFAFLRSVSCLLGAYLDFSRALPGSSDDLWMAQAFCILRRLLPGDEERSVRVIRSICDLINPMFMGQRNWHVAPVIWEKKGMESAVPFLTYALRHNEAPLAPVWSTPTSISTAATQRLPAVIFSMRDEGRLPLSRAWASTPLDHLLRSGQSEAFKALPSSWDFSETEVIRATLLFVKVQRQVLMSNGLTRFALSREETVFVCMKVFMLEHDQQQVTSTEEVFRDNLVGQLMDELVAPFAIAASTDSNAESGNTSTLEDVAKGFLGPSTPFYQYYTDLVALYDAISFSHPLFARLLLPPLAMRYASDYRKFFWADYGHILRTIKTPVEAVIAPSVREYLWPAETNAEILSAYLRALAKGPVIGFLRLVAVHHIACTIWPDLRSHKDSKEQAIKLLEAVVGQCDFDTTRDVVAYHQDKEHILYPPECFILDPTLQRSRKDFVGHCSSIVASRLDKLL